MLSTSPRLRIRHPSPTTAEFTVTTLRPIPPALHTLILLTRFLVTVFILLLLYARLTLSPLLASIIPPLLKDFVPRAHLQAPASISALAENIPVSVLVPGSFAVLWLLSRRGYLAGTATRFIPTEKIQDILVNEAFLGFEVRYYLVVVVEGEEDIVVVFPRLLPRRKIVEEVWRGVRRCLYESRTEEKVQN
ncbi:hypothetical protein Neosp_005257 [[Neocosmospora] mangrovei]